MEKTNYKLGHRSRVKDSFLKHGADVFCDYEILELLLFYTIPRRDTKGMAHALMREFVTLEAVLTASEEELCRVDGIGPNTARFLRSIIPYASYVLKNEPRPRACCESKDIRSFFEGFFAKNPDVPTIALLLDNSHCPLRLVRLKDVASVEGFANRIPQLVSNAYTVNAPAIILAGRPFDEASSNIHVLSDIGRAMGKELEKAGVVLLEMVQVIGGQVMPVFRYTKGTLQEAGAFDLIRHGDNDLLFGGSPEAKEKLLEFLSLAIGKASAEENAQKILSVYPSILNACAVPYATLTEKDGIHSAVALLLRLALDTYARAKETSALKSGKPIRTASELGEIFSNAIGSRANETMAIATLDDKMRLMAIKVFREGTVNTAVFSYRGLLEEAVRQGASYVAVAHNHPLGVTAPSMNDFAITAGAKNLFESMKVTFLEHFIVTEREFLYTNRAMPDSDEGIPEGFFK